MASAGREHSLAASTSDMNFAVTGRGSMRTCGTGAASVSRMPLNKRSRRSGMSWRKPVAMTVILTSSPMLLVEHRAEDDVGFFVSRVLDQRRSLVYLAQLQVAGAADVDEDALGAVDRAGFEQRRGHGRLGGFDGAVRATAAPPCP